MRIPTLLIVACLLWPASVADADVRFYVLPRVEITIKPGTRPTRVPKYIADMPNVRTESRDTGADDQCIVAADLTDLQHAAVASQPDVVALPGLDELVGSRVGQLRSGLLAKRVPAMWILPNTTGLEIISRIEQVSLLLDWVRTLRKGRVVLDPGVTMSQMLTDQQVIDLQATGKAIALDVSMISTARTVEDALVALGDQLKPAPMLRK